MKKIIQTDKAPPPAGTYSQAVEASGTFVFVSGQTPRLPDGTRLTGAPFEAQARQTMENVCAVAEAAGCDLAAHCVQVTVYLKNLDDRHVFDAVFAQYVGKAPPARAIVQSTFIDFDVEVQAVLAK
jgi:2-iminobutanoate/2-iminopropanoate deaminase